MTTDRGAWWRRVGTRQALAGAALVAVGLVAGLWLGGGDAPSDDHPHAAGAEAGAVWTCSMHPQIRQPEPGDCPICGMDLIPLAAGAAGEVGAPTQVTLSERARALAELRTAPVRRANDAAAELRLLGRVVPDERTLRTVTAWVGGRIERLQVRTTGERVRAGQVIATLYSPEILAAHQDLRVAARQAERLAAAPEGSRAAAAAALEAARERLRLLGVPPAELARLEAQDAPARSIAIRSPFAGTVLERLATEGAYVQTGAPLYRIADLGRLWVELDAYEGDLARLEVGQPVHVTVDALPGEALEGEVVFVDPTVDPRTRTAQVRVEVPNPTGRLRPGMFAEATVVAEPVVGDSSPLVVPHTAPLFTGRRSLVYVEVPGADGAPAYEPRTVRLGPRLGDVYPVVAGLSEGERVVSRGAFVVDADLQIRGGSSMMTATDDRAPDEVIELPAAERRKLAPVVARYLDVQRALAEDDLPAAQAANAALEAALAVELAAPREAAALWGELGRALLAHARQIAAAEDLERARLAFEGLSGHVERLLRRLGNPLDRPVTLAFCPMAFGSEGASWVQEGETIDNAYFGDAMRTCGEVRERVAPGAYLSFVEPAARPGTAP